MSLFHDAAQDGDLKLLRKVSKRDAAREDADGMTPLHWVGWSGNVDAAKILLQKGGSGCVGNVDNGGNTVLHVTAQYGNVKLTRHLVEETGASVWALNDDGKTACEVAAEASQTTTFRYLDALQLRLRVDDPEKADKARLRARKVWTKRVDRKDKTTDREHGAEKAVAAFRRRQVSASALPQSHAVTTAGRPTADAELQRPAGFVLPSQAADPMARGRTLSDPIQEHHTTEVRRHPDIAEGDDADSDDVFASSLPPDRHYGAGKPSSLSQPKQLVAAHSLDNEPPRSKHLRPQTSLDDPSASQVMAKYQSSNLRSRFSLRPAMSSSAITSSTSGLGTDQSGVSSVDTSMGSSSGSRTAMAIARIKGLGGLSALTHSGGRRRKTSAPVKPTFAEDANAFRRYRTDSRSAVPAAAGKAAHGDADSQSVAAGMRRSVSSASAKSAQSSRSLPVKLLPPPPAKGMMPAPGKSANPQDDAISPDMDEAELGAMAAFLHMLELDDHLSLLEEEQMDLDSLMLCSDLDLKDLDMGLGPRRKILAAVQKRKTTLNSSDRGMLRDSQV